MKPNCIRCFPSFALIMTLLGGCGGYRLIVDVVPVVNRLVETTVIEDDDGSWGSPDKVAMIDVTGVISDGGNGPNPLESGESPVSLFAEALKKAAGDDRVKAIIVAINSPGGTVTASDLMYRELKHFKEISGKPVVVLMGALTASGGYYIAMGGDELIANPTTITGSIGVIMQTINFSEGLSRIGIRADAITSGPNKAVGNPFEPMTDEHRELLQGIVNELYATFRGIVLESRPQLAGENLEMITDGRVVTGTRAVELGVVDRLGDIRDAFAAAKQHAKLTRAKLVKYHRATAYVGSPYAMYDGSVTPSSQINLMQFNLGGASTQGRSQFLYLWDPMVW